MDGAIRIKYVMKQMKHKTGILKIHLGHLMPNID